MSVPVADVPDSLKKDRDVAPIIARARELQSVNPVVSYYCQIYVLEHILSKKLHSNDKDVETFVVSLLDHTEMIKNDTLNEEVHKVLASRQLSVNLVFLFAFKLFNSCLEDLSNYDGSNKIQLASKLRATINFFTVLKVFTGEDESTIDFSNTTGGSCSTKQEFDAFNKTKLKTLKWQLTKLSKDEVPLKGENDELAELEKLTLDDESTQQQLSENEQPDVPLNLSDSADNDATKSNEDEGNAFNLPRAPKYDPKAEDALDDNEVRLPGAPSFLPDDDLSHINKDSSIQVFKSEERAPSQDHRPQEPSKPFKPSNRENHKPITRDEVNSIVDRTDQIARIQKHAKFAVSALNYEDLETAEKELLDGLALLRAVKDQS